jgi:hypothetical protein
MIDMRVCLLHGELFGGASGVDQKQPPFVKFREKQLFKGFVY